ncbi:ECF transporter S component [Streptococcus merionis]|uniref:Membrane protein n=1 Tax=Streptococcus merionis TaxID=400065 RepID=A0A239SQB2_9STRE|nr:ECF transporter S component [Streptococcus merionis]SNU87556.1 membrane protein [Streptococcus merionis]
MPSLNRKKQSNTLAVVAMFFATMLVIHFMTSFIFNVLPVPIKPTLVHVPVIIASIIYGPRIGASLGFLMGIISVVTNTMILLPTSYLFSPFVPNGNINSLIIAMIPRILIGITPYFVYNFLKNKTGLIIAGAIGSMTNTLFVLGGIFILFANVYSGDVQAMLATVFGANAIAEMVISAILTVAVVPVLEKLAKR